MGMINETPEWINLVNHFRDIGNIHMRDFFARDSNRGTKFALEAGDLYIDYSKSWMNDETLPLLFKLAERVNLKQAIEDIFSGKKINTTEKRSVLHTALRNTANTPIYLNGINIMDEVNTELTKMRQFTLEIKKGIWKGFTGKKIKNIVNIGIGGSDLGPMMVYKALKAYSDRKMKFRFVSNVDGSDLQETLVDLKPEETLFVIVSKTFTTQETLTNAESAKKWLLNTFKDDKAVKNHFVAVSTNAVQVEKFGIDPKNMFRFWDWVGGRYSVTSAVGLSVMLAIGPDNFDDFRQGFYEMDMHFKNTAFERNAPVIMALIGIWYSNFFHTDTYAILPYSQYLSRFSAYLEQTDMESNGKSVTKAGEHVKYETGPIIWGEVGTNGQHAFFQLLHQGTRFVPCDFIGFIRANNPAGDHQQKLLAHMFAQSEALAFGETVKEVKSEEDDPDLIPHKTYVGNRPSITILAEKLTPRILGELIALYEHKIFVQGIIWDINSFDQMGVELGKRVANRILKELLDDNQPLTFDSSTNHLIRKYRELK
jgi:glucose-6-phosphate isomerase